MLRAMTLSRPLAVACLVVCVVLGVTACDFAPLDLQSSKVSYEDLTPSTIPAAWVREGTPKARLKQVARAEDDGMTAMLWDCTAGSFEWYFASDEIVHILHGEVEVTGADGKKLLLQPGDVAFFPAGMKSLWRVPKYVKKLAVLRDNKEPFLRKLSRKWSELVG
jgi:uncharacterized cupin superfamily protein